MFGVKIQSFWYAHAVNNLLSGLKDCGIYLFIYLFTLPFRNAILLYVFSPQSLIFSSSAGTLGLESDLFE